jgi:hypothetical protein
MANTGTIANAANLPLFAKSGTTPDVSGALQSYYQSLTFEPLVKTVTGFQVVETANPINFWGNVQPYNQRQLILLPVGQRAWTWISIFCDPVVTLQVDDVVLFKNKQTRVMARQDNALYGFIRLDCVQDWLGSGT